MVVVAKPGDQIGDYLIEQHVEDGAVGSIWKARHIHSKKIFAMKILPYDRFPDENQKTEAIARFEREVQAVNQLQDQHKHFVPTVEVSVTSDGSPYFVMEYLEGMPLSRYLAAKKYLCGAEILHLMRQLCDALQAVHQHTSRIIHRDIKPDNIFLVPQQDGSQLVKILDFGLAKLGRQSSLTHTHKALGTPHYMAPEQWQNAKYVDHRVDIYALGLILFEMLTGERTFEKSSDSLVEIMYSHVRRQPSNPSSVAPWRGIPAALDALVQSTLSKQPSQRPASCAELLQRLNTALEQLASETEAMLRQRHP